MDSYVKIKVDKDFTEESIQTKMLTYSFGKKSYTITRSRLGLIAELWSSNINDHRYDPVVIGCVTEREWKPLYSKSKPRDWTGTILVNTSKHEVVFVPDQLTALLEYTGASRSFGTLFYKYRKRIDTKGRDIDIKSITYFNIDGKVCNGCVDDDGYIYTPRGSVFAVIHQTDSGKSVWLIASNGIGGTKAAEKYKNKIKRIIKGE